MALIETYPRISFSLLISDACQLNHPRGMNHVVKAILD